MGNTNSSTSTQKYDTTVVNKNDLKLLNENITNVTTNTMMDSASNCSASQNNIQLVDASSMDIAGDLNLDVDQNLQANVSFSCLQSSDFSSDVANSLLTDVMNKLQSNYSSDVLDKMNAQAKLDSQNGFLSSAIGNSNSSNSSINYNMTNINETRKDIANVVKNNISNNLDMKNIQNCIGQQTNSQKVTVNGTKVGGNANIGVKQNIAAKLVTSCVQKSNLGSKLATDLKNSFHMQDETDAQFAKRTDASTSSTAQVVNTGPIQEIGGIITSVFGSYTTSLISLGVLCFLLCLCIIVLCFMSGRGEKNQSGGSSMSEALINLS